MTTVPKTWSEDADLHQRVRREFLALPGLRLTLAQACRLWHTDVAVGRHVLDSLVEAAFLCRCGGCYLRADSDRACI